MKPIMKIRMLGNFTITFQGKELTFTDFRSLQITRLFCFLSINPKNADKNTLATYIFKNSEVNRHNGIKTLIYRTRILFKEYFGIEQIIYAKGGYYYLSDAIDYQFDYRVILSAYEKFKAGIEPLEQAKLSIATYKGPLLPMVEGDIELIKLDHEITSAHAEMTIYALSSVLENNDLFSKLALSLFVDDANNDQLQVEIIQQMCEHHETDLAKRYFDVVHNSYASHLSRVAQLKIDEMIQAQHQLFNDYMQAINNDFGVYAFVCTPKEFVHLCQLRVRQMRRGKWKGFVVKISTSQASDLLLDDFIYNLRSGDCISRFSEREYFLLLNVKEKNIKNIMKRLKAYDSHLSYEYRNLASLAKKKTRTRKEAV